MYSPSCRTAAEVCACVCAEASPAATSTAAQPSQIASARISSSARKGLDVGLRPPEDQRVNVVRALVGVHRFEVQHVADDVELIRDAVATMHVACDTRDVESLAGRVALDQGDRFWCGAAFVLEAADA